jgi:hypothetical protein
MLMARGNGTWLLASHPSFTEDALLMEVGDSLLTTRRYIRPSGTLSIVGMALATDGGIWVCGSTVEDGNTHGLLMRLDPALEACAGCASWEPASSTGPLITSSEVNFAFEPLGTARHFLPTVTSGMVWTPICLSTEVATADVEVPNGSWITPGAGSLSIAPPGPASVAYTWSILDVAGRELATGRAAGGQRTDTGFTATGVHVLVLRGAGGALHTERFVLP